MLQGSGAAFGIKSLGFGIRGFRVQWLGIWDLCSSVKMLRKQAFLGRDF